MCASIYWGGTLVAIDGALFHGNASKGSILTKKRLQEQIAALDQNIAEYNAALDANDQAEAAEAAGQLSSGEDIAQRVAALRQRRAAAASDLAKLVERGDGQISRTDPALGYWPSPGRSPPVTTCRSRLTTSIS